MTSNRNQSQLIKGDVNDPDNLPMVKQCEQDLMEYYNANKTFRELNKKDYIGENMD